MSKLPLAYVGQFIAVQCGIVFKIGRVVRVERRDSNPRLCVAFRAIGERHVRRIPDGERRFLLAPRTFAPKARINVAALRRVVKQHRNAFDSQQQMQDAMLDGGVFSKPQTKRLRGLVADWRAEDRRWSEGEQQRFRETSR